MEEECGEGTGKGGGLRAADRDATRTAGYSVCSAQRWGSMSPLQMLVSQIGAEKISTTPEGVSEVDQPRISEADGSRISIGVGWDLSRPQAGERGGRPWHERAQQRLFTHSQTDAETAVRTLQKAGFPMTKLSIVWKDVHSEEHVTGYYSAGD